MPRLIVVMFLVAAVASTVLGQELPRPPAPAMSKSLPLHSTLYAAAQLGAANRLDLPGLRAELTRRGITLATDAAVHVVIAGRPGGASIAGSFLAAFGGRVETQADHLTDCWIPLERLVDCARALPAGYFIENANATWLADVAGEGPGVVNSAGYPDGAGLTVGLIDAGFAGLAAAVANGDAPAVRVDRNYTAEPFDAGSVHGTGCTEAVFDHCPAAAYRLYKVDTAADWIIATADAVAAGVDVLSTSLNIPTDGWHNDEGSAAAALNYAASQGVLVFNSAGNYAANHYQGGFNPGSGDPDWHNFAGDDETLNLNISAGASIQFSLLWNRDGDTYDYDFYLFDMSLNLLASSTSGSDYYEWFTWTNSGSGTVQVQLAVLRYDGGETEFEIYSQGGDWLQYEVPSSSVACPGNATGANVLTIGAVYHGEYGHGSGTTGIIESYSSRGPTNDGTAVPDLCGPTGTSTLTYGEMFGTSNSTPNCAGAAICFWAADPLLSANAVRWLILEQAALWKDWGDPGFDLTYGRGGMVLADYYPARLWVASQYGNLYNLRGAPLRSVAGALHWAVAGGTVQVFPGGNYPEILTIDQHVTLRTTATPAVIGP